MQVKCLENAVLLPLFCLGTCLFLSSGARLFWRSPDCPRCRPTQNRQLRRTSVWVNLDHHAALACRRGVTAPSRPDPSQQTPHICPLECHWFLHLRQTDLFNLSVNMRYIIHFNEARIINVSKIFTYLIHWANITQHNAQIVYTANGVQSLSMQFKTHPSWIFHSCENVVIPHGKSMCV